MRRVGAWLDNSFTKFQLIPDTQINDVFKFMDAVCDEVEECDCIDVLVRSNHTKKVCQGQCYLPT